MSAHTPGPWSINRSRVDAGDFQFLVTNMSGAPAAEWEANARLIAAAPDLLKALKMCVIERSEWLVEARAAIEKATEGK